MPYLCQSVLTGSSQSNFWKTFATKSNVKAGRLICNAPLGPRVGIINASPKRTTLLCNKLANSEIIGSSISHDHITRNGDILVSSCIGQGPRVREVHPFSYPLQLSAYNFIRNPLFSVPYIGAQFHVAQTTSDLGSPPPQTRLLL